MKAWEKFKRGWVWVSNVTRPLIFILMVLLLWSNLHDGWLLWRYTTALYEQNRMLREQNDQLYKAVEKVGNLYLMEQQKNGTGKIPTAPIQ